LEGNETNIMSVTESASQS